MGKSIKVGSQWKDNFFCIILQNWNIMLNRTIKRRRIYSKGSNGFYDFDGYTGCRKDKSLKINWLQWTRNKHHINLMLKLQAYSEKKNTVLS